MNGPNETVHDRDVTGEELMAYLDGELDAERRRQLDEQISGNSELRQQVKELQQTWDLLDELPREPVGDEFTRITVEMVAVQAEGEVDQYSRRATQWQKIGMWFGIILAAAASLVGFALTHSKLSEPNRRLVEDLPILQQLDAYQNADSIDFLRKLEHEGLFKEEATDAN